MYRDMITIVHSICGHNKLEKVTVVRYVDPVTVVSYRGTEHQRKEATRDDEQGRRPDARAPHRAAIAAQHAAAARQTSALADDVARRSKVVDTGVGLGLDLRPHEAISIWRLAWAMMICEEPKTVIGVLSYLHYKVELRQ